MATPTGMRIGHADREAAAASLREHYAVGRLTLEEFQQRLSAVFSAKTDADLARITRDLPHVSNFGPALSSAQPPGSLPAGAGAWSQQGSWQAGGSGSRGQSAGWGQSGQRGRSGGSAIFGFLLTMVTIAIIASFVFPFALFGIAASRPLVILLAVIALGRKIFRWLFKFGTKGRRR
jgi:Domain of unknown function (DUF1707)